VTLFGRAVEFQREAGRELLRGPRTHRQRLGDPLRTLTRVMPTTRAIAETGVPELLDLPGKQLQFRPGGSRRNARTAFNPPNANALDKAASTWHSRAAFGTTSKSHSGSGAV